MIDEHGPDGAVGARMVLTYQTHSPYARKALVFAHELGIADPIDVLHQETSPSRRNQQVFDLNPLGKVPVLITPDAGAIFDSCVICEYLAALHDGSGLLPAAGETRWRALRMQSVAQGIAEAGIMVRWETERRPEHLRYALLRDGYVDKLVASYDWLER